MQITTNRRQNADKYNWKQIGDKPKLGNKLETENLLYKSFSIGPLSQSLTDFPPVRIDADCLLAIEIVTALLI